MSDVIERIHRTVNERIRQCGFADEDRIKEYLVTPDEWDEIFSSPRMLETRGSKDDDLFMQTHFGTVKIVKVSP